MAPDPFEIQEDRQRMREYEHENLLVGQAIQPNAAAGQAAQAQAHSQAGDEGRPQLGASHSEADDESITSEDEEFEFEAACHCEPFYGHPDADDCHHAITKLPDFLNTDNENHIFRELRAVGSNLYADVAPGVTGPAIRAPLMKIYGAYTS